MAAFDFLVGVFGEPYPEPKSFLAAAGAAVVVVVLVLWVARGGGDASILCSASEMRERESE